MSFVTGYVRGSFILQKTKSRSVIIMKHNSYIFYARVTYFIFRMDSMLVCVLLSLAKRKKKEQEEERDTRRHHWNVRVPAPPDATGA